MYMKKSPHYHFKIFQLLAYIYKQSRKPYILRSAGFSEATLSGSTLFQNKIYHKFSMEKGLLIKRENGNIPLLQNHTFLKFISNYNH